LKKEIKADKVNLNKAAKTGEKDLQAASVEGAGAVAKEKGRQVNDNIQDLVRKIN
jgi:hypothetical protein